MASTKTEVEDFEGDGRQKSIINTELGEEKSPPNFPEFEAAPDGGPRAWLVATGAACIFFSTLGFLNSFGVFQEYYITHQLHDQSPSTIAWIGSVAAFLQFAAGAIGGPLFDRVGEWVCLRILYFFKGETTDIAADYPASRSPLRICHNDDKPV